MRLLLSFAGVLALPFMVQAGQSSNPSDEQMQQTKERIERVHEERAQSDAAHVMYEADELKWADGPPAFERGAKIAVLSGDPGQPGLFVLRLKLPAGFEIANHWHPTDEHVTVLEGDFTVKMDQDAAGAHQATFSPGGYVALPAKMHHAASTRGGATVQVSGMGPFAITYVDPDDDPRKRSADEQ